MKHFGFLSLAVVAALSLTACVAPTSGTPATSTPVSSAAHRTTMDERALAGVYTTAEAAERAYAVAYDAGVLSRGDAATIRVRAVLDGPVATAVRAAQAAYDAGNADTFAGAVSNLVAAVTEVSQLTGRPVAVAPALQT